MATGPIQLVNDAKLSIVMVRYVAILIHGVDRTRLSCVQYFEHFAHATRQSWTVFIVENAREQMFYHQDLEKSQRIL